MSPIGAVKGYVCMHVCMSVTNAWVCSNSVTKSWMRVKGQGYILALTSDVMALLGYHTTCAYNSFCYIVYSIISVSEIDPPVHSIYGCDFHTIPPVFYAMDADGGSI